MKMHVPESKRIMSLLIMLLTTSFVFAQVTVTGNVRDERGDEVIGATVLLIGSQHGVLSLLLKPTDCSVLPMQVLQVH